MTDENNLPSGDDPDYSLDPVDNDHGDADESQSDEINKRYGNQEE